MIHENLVFLVGSPRSGSTLLQRMVGSHSRVFTHPEPHLITPLAYLGYYALAPFAGRGLMREGVELLLTHAFGPLALHRVEANVQPDNAASLRLVERVGFAREGYSRRYVKIAGQWRDHVRYALLAEDWRSRRARRR